MAAAIRITGMSVATIEEEVTRPHGDSRKGTKGDNNNNNNVDKMLQDNIALVRLLLILSRAGHEGISTVELLKKLKSSNYGQRMIKLAASEGYIERTNVKQTEEGRKGGSKTFVINRLSPKGKRFISKLTQSSGDEGQYS